ncbi:MAG: hypothetical protein CMJ18_11095 [Phycisphaeraceae bacterium]|nr:hypothetical protein [Phycisphaeraceae bacterium]
MIGLVVLAAVLSTAAFGQRRDALAVAAIPLLEPGPGDAVWLRLQADDAPPVTVRWHPPAGVVVEDPPSAATWRRVADGLAVLAGATRTLEVSALVRDPASPRGFRETAPQRIVLAADAARVAFVTPNRGPAGTPLSIAIASTDRTVSELLFRGHHGTVPGTPAADGTFRVLTHATFEAGPVGIRTPDGDLVADPDDIDAHFARTHLPVAPVRNGITPVPGSATVEDTLDGRADLRLFGFAGVEGAVLEAHAYAIDPWTNRLADPARDSRLPRLRLTLFEEPSGRFVRESTIDGPGDNPWLHLRLPRTGSYLVRLDAIGGDTNGRFLLNVSLDQTPSGGEVPVVVQVSPQVGRPGDVIEITGAFFSDDARVLIGGVAMTARVLSPTRLQAQIPWGTVSGPVQVETRWGLSPYEPDEIAHHVAVLSARARGAANESLVTIGEVVTSDLLPGGLAHYYVDLDAGDAIVLNAWATDPTLERVLGGWRTGTGRLDLALLVSGPGLGRSWTDENSGPGRNPSIGASRTFPFRAPTGGRYAVTVIDRSATGGPFLLSLADPEEPGGRVPLYTMPLAVKVFIDPYTGVTALDRKSLDAQLAQLAVWGQAGIYPHAVSVQWVTPSPDHYIVDGESEMAEIMRLYGTHGAQDVFVTGGLPPGPGGSTTLGLTWTPTGQVFLNGPELPRAGSDEPALTLAHELGHVLGRLPDILGVQTDNLMHGNLATQTDARLGLEQVNQVRYFPDALRPAGTYLVRQPILILPFPRDNDPPR